MTILYVVYLLMVGCSATLYQGLFSGAPSCRKQHVFDEVIVGIVPVSTLAECVLECLEYPKCLSFNYCTVDSVTTCQLSTEPTDGTCDQLKPKPGCNYYEKASNNISTAPDTIHKTRKLLRVSTQGKLKRYSESCILLYIAPYLNI